MNHRQIETYHKMKITGGKVVNINFISLIFFPLPFSQFILFLLLSVSLNNSSILTVRARTCNTKQRRRWWWWCIFYPFKDNLCKFSFVQRATVFVIRLIGDHLSIFILLLFSHTLAHTFLHFSVGSPSHCVISFSLSLACASQDQRDETLKNLMSQCTALINFLVT